jgi:hypothetical protein
LKQIELKPKILVDNACLAMIGIADAVVQELLLGGNLI